MDDASNPVHSLLDDVSGCTDAHRMIRRRIRWSDGAGRTDHGRRDLQGDNLFWIFCPETFRSLWAERFKRFRVRAVSRKVLDQERADISAETAAMISARTVNVFMFVFEYEWYRFSQLGSLLSSFLLSWCSALTKKDGDNDDDDDDVDNNVDKYENDHLSVYVTWLELVKLVLKRSLLVIPCEAGILVTLSCQFFNHSTCGLSCEKKICKITAELCWNEFDVATCKKLESAIFGGGVNISQRDQGFPDEQQRCCNELANESM